jgi:hypothetical protein
VSAGADEILLLLRSLPSLTVHDAKVPDAAPLPYALTYFAMTTADGAEVTPLTLDTQAVDLTLYLHNVAGNAAAARAVQWKTWTALVNARVTITGRKTWPVRQIDDAPATKDESTGKLIVDLTDVYRLRSIPA